MMMVVKPPVVVLPGVCLVLLIHVMVLVVVGLLTNLQTGSCLAKLERDIDLVEICRRDVSCHHVQNISMDTFLLKVVKSVLLLHTIKQHIIQSLLLQMLNLHSLFGFYNWKKATTTFKQHGCSRAHGDAVAFNISATKLL